MNLISKVERFEKKNEKRKSFEEKKFLKNINGHFCLITYD